MLDSNYRYPNIPLDIGGLAGSDGFRLFIANGVRHRRTHSLIERLTRCLPIVVFFRSHQAAAQRRPRGSKAFNAAMAALTFVTRQSGFPGISPLRRNDAAPSEK